LVKAENGGKGGKANADSGACNAILLLLYCSLLLALSKDAFGKVGGLGWENGCKMGGNRAKT